jgi:hypothetical protein
MATLSNPQIKNVIPFPTKAPNLPTAPSDYSQNYQEQILKTLRLYFAQIDNFTQAISIALSGSTSGRPTKQLSVGLFYFDTTLNIPIWYNGTNWVNASGTTV